MPPVLDTVLLEGWADAATTALERHRAHIDRINVFPVADRDTGTNLLLTMQAAVAAVRADAPAGGPSGAGACIPEARGTVATAEALARGALRGARGNSGVILSQVLRGVAEAVGAAEGPRGGAALADALGRAAASVFGLLQRTEDAGSREILLVAAQEEFVAPTRTFAVDEV